MAKAEDAKPGIKIIAENRKARAEFFIEESYEAGLVLTGTEVKSLREGRANLKEAFGEVRDGEAWLVDCHISPYAQGNISNHEPTRPRKLLLHKEEIKRLLGRTQEKGFTLVPLKMYFSKGKAKVEMGLGKGKKLHDRREELKARAAGREVERALRERNKGE
ncbi:MAG: SsrA-binding protein SmpB [Candidatus Tectomicrobia bacterium]|nr:SsrA-binding protein SmpB [Candidatus Tectomicrobia bacterium]